MSKLSGIRYKEVIFITILLLSISVNSAMGSGFALIEQSVSGLGNAFAGGSAIFGDATTIFYNPAGLARLSVSQFVAGAHIVMPSAKFNNGGSKSVIGTPLIGDNGGDGGVTGVVPNMYFSTKYNDALSCSLYHQINPQWAIMGDVIWTNWSLFEELRIKFSPGQSDGVTTTKWDDSMRYSLGVSYMPDKWTYRAGVAYDRTPIPNAQDRTPRIPDGDRTWLAVGLGYKYSDEISMDIGYAYLFVNDPEVNKTATGENIARGTLRGTYDANVNILSAQIKWMF